jgi:hypothetical protein
MSKIAFASLLTSLVAAPALAATYVTGPVDVANGDTALCVVQNLTDQPRTVSTRMWHGNPRVLHDEDADVTIGPRVTTIVQNRSEASTGVYCEIEGLSKKLRGYIAVTAGGTTHVLLPAVK